MLLIHDHAHIEFNLIAGPLDSEIFDLLDGLPFSQVPVLYMDIDVFQP